MRKLATIGLAVTALFALVAVALAQTIAAPAPAEVDVTASVTPAKGGSKKKPKNAGTLIKFDVNKESFSTLAGISYGIPKSLKISGKGFPKCTVDDVNEDGQSSCPKKSRVGSGASTALVGPGQAPVQFKVKVYTAGKNRLTLSLKQNPFPPEGGVEANFDAKIKQKKNRISFDIPDEIQQPAPGLYSYVTSVTAKLGRAKIKKGKGKKKKKFFLVSRVGCKGGKDVVGVRLPLADNPNPPAVGTIIGTGKTPCNK